MPRCAGAAVLAVPAAAYVRTSWRDLAADPSYGFADYTAEYGKSYGAAERARRADIFARNVAGIRAHNADPAAVWRAGLNGFTDWTTEEMRRVKGLHTAAPHPASLPPPPPLRDVDLSALPASVDWREREAVTPVKMQYQCGSCWAHSVTEGVESAVAIATGRLLVLSVEQLVSCAPVPDYCGGTGGCNGSNTWVGYKYVVDKGITTEAAWPYTAQVQACNATKVDAAVVHIKNYTRLPVNDYASLMHAVATIGPISISIDSHPLYAYESGVFSGECGTNIDHSMQLVGYGTDNSTGLDYWLVRNSWDTSFGEQGYIRYRRFGLGKEPCGVDNQTAHRHTCQHGPDSFPVCGMCGIMSDTVYATGASIQHA